MNSSRCTLNRNESVLPPISFVTDKRINNVPIRDGEILKLIRNLNPKKETGSDSIIGQMLLFCRFRRSPLENYFPKHIGYLHIS